MLELVARLLDTWEVLERNACSLQRALTLGVRKKKVCWRLQVCWSVRFFGICGVLKGGFMSARFLDT